MGGHILPLETPPRVTFITSSYLLTSYHTVRVSINSTKMNMSIITCHTAQHDNTGTLLYYSNTSLTIQVSSLPTSLPVQSSPTISLFFFLILAVLGISTGE